MRTRGVGVGGVVTSIGWISEKPNGCVPEEELVQHLQIRCGVSREKAEFAIKLAEKCGAVGRKIGRKGDKIYVKPRKIYVLKF